MKDLLTLLARGLVEHPDDVVVTEDAPAEDGSVTYYRENGVHYVQKRALKDLILE